MKIQLLTGDNTAMFQRVSCDTSSPGSVPQALQRDQVKYVLLQGAGVYYYSSNHLTTVPITLYGSLFQTSKAHSKL
jgi:hypothetical protein